MGTQKKKFWIDILMFMDFLVLAISGAVLKFVYPAGQKSGRAGVIFLFDRFGWLTVHDWAVVILLVFLLLHLMYNWNWIKNMFGLNFFSRKENISEVKKLS